MNTLFVLLLAAQVSLSDPGFVDQLVAPVVAGGVTYDFTETFEGSQADSQSVAGYDNIGWTSSSSDINPNYDTSPAPLSGTDSLNVPYGWVNISRAISATDTLYVRMILYAPSWVAYEYPVAIYNDSTMLCAINTRGTDGTLILVSGSTGSSETATDGDGGVVFYLWLEYEKGSGANSVSRAYISTTGTKPGSATIAVTTGNATLGANKLTINGSHVVDDIIYDFSTPIGSVE